MTYNGDDDTNKNNKNNNNTPTNNHTQSRSEESIHDLRTYKAKALYTLNKNNNINKQSGNGWRGGGLSGGGNIAQISSSPYKIAITHSLLLFLPLHHTPSLSRSENTRRVSQGGWGTVDGSAFFYATYRLFCLSSPPHIYQT